MRGTLYHAKKRLFSRRNLILKRRSCFGEYHKWTALLKFKWRQLNVFLTSTQLRRPCRPETRWRRRLPIRLLPPLCCVHQTNQQKNTNSTLRLDKIVFLAQLLNYFFCGIKSNKFSRHSHECLVCGARTLSHCQNHHSSTMDQFPGNDRKELLQAKLQNQGP